MHLLITLAPLGFLVFVPTALALLPHLSEQFLYVSKEIGCLVAKWSPDFKFFFVFVIYVQAVVTLKEKDILEFASSGTPDSPPQMIFCSDVLERCSF